LAADHWRSKWDPRGFWGFYKVSLLFYHVLNALCLHVGRTYTYQWLIRTDRSMIYISMLLKQRISWGKHLRFFPKTSWSLSLARKNTQSLRIDIMSLTTRHNKDLPLNLQTIYWSMIQQRSLAIFKDLFRPPTKFFFKIIVITTYLQRHNIFYFWLFRSSFPNFSGGHSS
jgi:hypothetical protein